MTTTKSRSHTESDDPHWIEWLTGLVSAALVIALIGWVGYEAATGSETPPDLTVEQGKVENVSDGYRVQFAIRNSAPTTAAAVVVRGEIRDRDTVVEDAEISFDYVPAQSQARGALFFETDPSGKAVTVRAVGYTDP